MTGHSVRPAFGSLFAPQYGDLRDYQPADPERFGIDITAFVGEAGDEPAAGADACEFVYCTPAWLLDNFAGRDAPGSVLRVAGIDSANGVLFGRGLFLTDRWSYQVLEETVISICAKISGNSWDDVGNGLSRYFFWEGEVF
jgi:hypothetical protein